MAWAPEQFRARKALVIIDQIRPQIKSAGDTDVEFLRHEFQALVDNFHSALDDENGSFINALKSEAIADKILLKQHSWEKFKQIIDWAVSHNIPLNYS